MLETRTSLSQGRVVLSIRVLFVILRTEGGVRVETCIPSVRRPRLLQDWHTPPQEIHNSRKLVWVYNLGIEPNCQQLPQKHSSKTSYTK